MQFAFFFLLLLQGRFWEHAEPRAWSDEQLLRMLSDSPWAQVTKLQDGSPVPVYLATARPARLAEEELERRYKSKQPAAKPTDDTAQLEYQAFLRENEGKVIVLAIRRPNVAALAEAKEAKMMEEESFLKIGKKKYRMTGHLPPGETDPVLRLVFPRPADLGKELNFELYLPGVTGPYRQAIFTLKEMMYEGKLEL